MPRPNILSRGSFVQVKDLFYKPQHYSVIADEGYLRLYAPQLSSRIQINVSFTIASERRILISRVSMSYTHNQCPAEFFLLNCLLQQQTTYQHSNKRYCLLPRWQKIYVPSYLPICVLYKTSVCYSDLIFAFLQMNDPKMLDLANLVLTSVEKYYKLNAAEEAEGEEEEEQ